MGKTIIKNSTIINEGKRIEGDLLIENERISQIGGIISRNSNVEEIDGEGFYLLPGLIDDQVHFREPGLTHKGDIKSESQAAVAGGVTSFMEMPNTKPPAITNDLLKQKYKIAHKSSYANFGFFMGTSNDNFDEIMKVDYSVVPGLKIFMGSSTGNLLVDDKEALESIFANFPYLIATHCEDENTIRENEKIFREKYGNNIPFSCHPKIRSRQGCLKSSSFAAEMANKFGTRLHILHISTKEELDLFTNEKPLADKKITSEACVHHLYFDQSQYDLLGSKIKCNPAIKDSIDREAIMKAVLDDRIDIIATDHAPHTKSEKDNSYFNSPSGLPLVQHSLDIMYDFVINNVLDLETLVRKMCHAPADCFRLKERGYIREEYFADLVLLNTKESYTVSKENIKYKCQWSPLEGKEFSSKVQSTFVNGNLVFNNDKVNYYPSKRLTFDRS